MSSLLQTGKWFHLYIYIYIYITRPGIEPRSPGLLANTHARIYIYIYMHIYIYIHTHRYMYIYIYTHMYIYIHTHTHAHTHTHIYIYTHTHTHTYIYVYIYIYKTQKMVLELPCLKPSIIRYGSRVKLVNPGKGVASSPTPWCSSYRKVSFRDILDYGRQLYVYIYIYIFVCVHVCVCECVWWFLSEEMDTVKRFQTLDVAVCISKSAFNLDNGMNLTIFSLPMSK